MAAQSDPRMRTSVYSLASSFLDGDRFSLANLPADVTSHSPFSKPFVQSLDDVKFMDRSWSGSLPFVTKVNKILANPENLTIFSTKLVEKTFLPTNIGVGAGTGKCREFSNGTPVSARFPAFTLQYHPTVGFEGACALFAYLCASGKFPWKIINVSEVVPSELRCFSVLWKTKAMNPSNPEESFIIHFWINKWDPMGAPTTGAVSHVGVFGGGSFALLSRLLAPLNLQVDLTGVVYSNLEVVEGDEKIRQLVPINTVVLNQYLMSTDRTLYGLIQMCSAGPTYGDYSSAAGLFHHLGGATPREKAAGIAKSIGLTKTGLYRNLVDNTTISPSTYAASWFLFGEKHHMAFSFVKEEEYFAPMAYTSVSSLRDTMWASCVNKLGRSWLKLLTPEMEEIPAAIRWKDYDVRDFWISQESTPKTLRVLLVESKVDPEVLVRSWRSLSHKVSQHREARGKDPHSSLIRHHHLENLRKLVT